MLKCICGPDLEILTWIDGEYWFGEAQHGVNFEFEVKFDFEGQCHPPPPPPPPNKKKKKKKKTIGTSAISVAWNIKDWHLS